MLILSFVKMSAQAESVIRNIIREITLECSAQGETISETLAAFIVSPQSRELDHVVHDMRR